MGRGRRQRGGFERALAVAGVVLSLPLLLYGMLFAVAAMDEDADTAPWFITVVAMIALGLGGLLAGAGGVALRRGSRRVREWARDRPPSYLVLAAAGLALPALSVAAKLAGADTTAEALLAPAALGIAVAIATLTAASRAFGGAALAALLFALAVLGFRQGDPGSGAEWWAPRLLLIAAGAAFAAVAARGRRAG